MEQSLHPAASDDQQLLAECDSRSARRSGPGGQHRNKVETAIILTHRPTGISAEANERRTARDNRRMATFRLRIKLAVEHREPVAGNQGPSQLWKSRCRSQKISVSPDHTDFPALLAEALDRIAACEFDLSMAANALDCTRSQLTRLIKQSPAAFTRLNSDRKQQGLHPVR